MTKLILDGAQPKPIVVQTNNPSKPPKEFEVSDSKSSPMDIRHRVKLAAANSKKEGGPAGRVAKSFVLDAMATIVELMYTSESDKIRLAAAKEIIDRGFGKAKTTVNHTGKVEHVADNLTADQRRAAALAILNSEKVVDGEVVNVQPTVEAQADDAEDLE